MIIPGVAAAYRSIPFSDNDFIWKNNNKTSNTYYHHHNDNKHGDIDDETTFNLITSDIQVKNYNCPHNDNDRNSSSSSKSSSYIDSKDCSEIIYNNGNYWQIHMPDFKLIKEQFNGITTNTPTTTTATTTKATLKNKNLKNVMLHIEKDEKKKRFIRNKSKLVVTWVVDTMEEVLILLSYGVDGIITNRPIEMLYDLQRIYKHYC
jgi:hypothetical protein